MGEGAAKAVPFGHFAESLIREWAREGCDAGPDYEGVYRLHLAPYLAERPIDQVTAADGVRISTAMATFGLAPRSRRNALMLLRAFLRRAVERRIIAQCPITVPPGLDVDADPAWRAEARFDRWELRLLVHDERIPELKRAAIALQYLLGLRAGELGGLSFDAIDRRKRPLVGVRVLRQYNKRTRSLEDPKCDQVRLVPLRRSGLLLIDRIAHVLYPRIVGRAATSEDPIIPVVRHGVLRRLRSDVAWHWMEEACEIVGIRRRGTHALRSTYVSELEEAGVPEALIRALVHKPPRSHTRNVVGGYSRPLWRRLCRAVKVIRFPAVDPQLKLPFR